MAVIYLFATALKVYLFKQWLTNGNAGPFIIFFKVNWLTMTMAGIRLMSIWLLAYHLYYYGKREDGLVKENSRLALMAKDAQLHNLSAQLNPHFLFNSLNTIKALVIEDPKSARRAIDLLSDLLRNSLYGNELLLWTIKDELALVADYLELERLRLEERLQFSIVSAPDLGEKLILRYSIQVLVENTVKHGISKQKEGGLINIKITQQDDVIKIVVQNPGKLETDTSLDGLGLKNLTGRLLLQYKGKAAFAITENAGIVSSSIYIPGI
jgi:LytS/YehU family sensor histidine kinase